MTVLLLTSLLSCDLPTPKEGTPADIVLLHPYMAAGPDDRERILSRIDREPYATLLARIEERAARERVEHVEGWNHSAAGANGQTAAANAALAWLFDDAQAAKKAKKLLLGMNTRFEQNTTWDVNIRMPGPLLGFTDAWDLLQATPYITEEEAARAGENITTLNKKFFDQYIAEEAFHALLVPAQNNHPIRTAVAVGYVAMAFPDHPDAEQWRTWSYSELDTLWGQDGRYVQADGGVSEGPFYHGFAFGVSMAFFLAADRVIGEGQPFERSCATRNLDQEPWIGQECVEGAIYGWRNPLHQYEYPASAYWSLALRMPDGQRPPLADAYLNGFNGGAVLGGVRGDGTLVWDWLQNADRPLETTWGADLTLQHLAWVDDTLPIQPPSYLNVFMPDAGNAVFRSGWDEEARWLLLVGENGPARMTLHDHVDGTSFSMAAYGEYLLIDPGYYKPTDTNNAQTSAPESHNVVFIDGKGAPDKGLLTVFGDTDAFIENTLDGNRVAYAEAHQSYERADIERSVAFVDGRYWVVADRIDSKVSRDRDFTFRLHGNAGHGAGGTFTAAAPGPVFERTDAGVQVHLTSTAGVPTFSEPAYDAKTMPHVDQFGLDRLVRDHGVADATVTGPSPGFLGIVAPYAVGVDPLDDAAPLDVVDVSPGNNVAAWRVAHREGVDLVVLREPDAPKSFTVDGQALNTDAELVVHRLSGVGNFTLLARGKRVSIDGDDIVSLTDAADVWLQE